MDISKKLKQDNFSTLAQAILLGITQHPHHTGANNLTNERLLVEDIIAEILDPSVIWAIEDVVRETKREYVHQNRDEFEGDDD